VSGWLSVIYSSWAGPVFLLITLAGLVLSGIAWRKKGARSGIRGIAWSLLPIAAWLTHSLRLIGHIVSAIVAFAGGFVFSPGAWLGVILVGASALLFLVSGGLPLLRARKKHKEKKGSSGSGGGQPQAAVATRKQKAVPAEPDDDMSDVRDILKRHGIS
jgi:hypothetical protein